MASPRYKGIITGDNLISTVIDEKPVYKNPKGIMLKKYLLLITADMGSRYPELFTGHNASLIIQTELGSARWFDYPIVWIEEPPYESATSTIVRVKCNLNGTDSWFTLKDRTPDKEKERLMEENETLRIGLISKSEELREVLIDFKSYLQNTAENYEIIKGEKSGQQFPNFPPGPSVPPA